MHWVTATDENDRDFPALTAHPNPPAEQHVIVWVFISGENGFGRPDGDIAMLKLKKLGDGRFGA